MKYIIIFLLSTICLNSIVLIAIKPKDCNEIEKKMKIFKEKSIKEPNKGWEEVYNLYNDQFNNCINATINKKTYNLYRQKNTEIIK
jgi:hypothetical protein